MSHSGIGEMNMLRAEIVGRPCTLEHGVMCWRAGGVESRKVRMRWEGFGRIYHSLRSTCL